MSSSFSESSDSEKLSSASVGSSARDAIPSAFASDSTVKQPLLTAL